MKFEALSVGLSLFLSMRLGRGSYRVWFERQLVLPFHPGPH